jgi:hypothetical protein
MLARFGGFEMSWIATALVMLAAAAQPPVPSINYTLPGQARPAPPAPPSIPADAEILAFQNAAIVTRPSPAVRHFLLAPAPRIPPRGVPFTVRCLIDRANGRVTHCQDPAVADPWRAAAIALGALYQFRLSPAQAQGRGALAVAISDRIVPSDVLPTARLFAFAQRPAGNVTFAQGLTGEQSQAYYPRGALEMELDARIRIDCQVQPDLSLFCLNPAAAAGSDPGRFLSQFQAAALQLSAALRAAPALTNGGPAAGTVFRTTIIFRVPEE